MTYVCTKGTTRPRVDRVEGRIECSVLDAPQYKWVFCEVGADAFHWQNVEVLPDGSRHLNCEVFARRK